MRVPGPLGLFVLLLLSIFFAQLVAPGVDALRRLTMRGKRQRPLPRAVAIVAIYAALAAGVTPVLVVGTPRITTAIDRTVIAADHRLAEVRGSLARRQQAQPLARLAGRTTMVLFDSFVRDMRRSLEDVVEARRQAGWLLFVPIGAFLLLNHAPAFRRSTLRRLPHGHLQWRADEYLRDVNSAIAGYIRAQVAAGAIVGTACGVGFTAIGVPSPLWLAAVAGALELVPVLGPVLVLVLATAPGGRIAVEAFAFLAVLRVVQDYVVYPRLVRRGMHLPTSAVVVAIWVGAAISGAPGVVLAIPVAGFAAVSYRHWREYRDIEQLVERTARERAAAAGGKTVNAENAETAKHR